MIDKCHFIFFLKGGNLLAVNEADVINHQEANDCAVLSEVKAGERCFAIKGCSKHKFKPIVV
jgi:hypothetical protein